jgi:pSer/pThr/pTyr-binding forkhead associated (FHA) protein
MAKIVLSLDGRIINQCFLDESRLSIGRDPACSLVVPAPEIALRQAEILCVVNDHFIEDQGGGDGTMVNGTMVNGTTVRRHLLQNGDVVFLGAYRLKYLNTASTRLGFDRTQLLDPAMMEEIAAVAAPAPITLDSASAAAHAGRNRLARGRVRGLAGPHAGKDFEIERVLLPVGTSGECRAVINRRPGGCFLTQVEGREAARVNGQPVGSAPVRLSDGDLIEAGPERLTFHAPGDSR